MLRPPAPGDRTRGLARQLVIALVAAAQLAVLSVGPLVDAPPAAGQHRAHIAAESLAGCHPYHDDHCVVCRALAEQVVDAGGPSLTESGVRPELPGPHAAPACVTGDDLHHRNARAPPVA